MIKKINILLIIISIIGGFYFAFTRDDNVVLVLKDISILFTINLLYIIQKIFKIKINSAINFIYISFIFIAHFLGVICELYNYIYWFDKFAHFISSIITSLVAIYILTKLNNKNSIFINILYIIAFTLMIASLWEIFEYLSSYYFNVDPQKVVLTGVNDTMGDIIVAFLGSILVSICYYFEIKYNYNYLIKKYIKMI